MNVDRRKEEERCQSEIKFIEHADERWMMYSNQAEYVEQVRLKTNRGKNSFLLLFISTHTHVHRKRYQIPACLDV